MKKQSDSRGRGLKGSGLTPFKVIIIYLVAFGLVSLHEVDRLSSWAKELSWDWGVGAQTADLWQDVDQFANWTGLLEVTKAESAWLDGMKFPIVGVISDSLIPEHKKRDHDLIEEGLTSGATDVVAPAGSLKDQAPETPLAMTDGSLIPDFTVKPQASGPCFGIEGFGTTWPQTSPENLAVEPTRLSPSHILIAGDSMILEGFGVALERRLKGLPGLTVVRKGRYSSGLARPDYFNWMPYLKELLDKYKPDLLVVSLGANDPQDIVDEHGKRHYVATPDWNEQYAARARQFIETAQEAGCFIFWVGLPIMGRAPYGARIENLNEVVRGVCQDSAGCTYVDTWLVLADSKGDYTTFIKNSKGKHIRIRAKDRIHLTEAGGEIMVDHFLEDAEQYVKLPEPEENSEGKEKLPGGVAGQPDSQNKPAPTPDSHG